MHPLALILFKTSFEARATARVRRFQHQLEIEFIYNYLIIELHKNYTIKSIVTHPKKKKSIVTFNIDTNTSVLSHHFSLKCYFLYFIVKDHIHKKFGICYIEAFMFNVS